jgi:2-polyprenyl-3-methyl-5-hydroxy-6-metoxy-1,4-benzoquinol methylase
MIAASQGLAEEPFSRAFAGAHFRIPRDSSPPKRKKTCEELTMSSRAILKKQSTIPGERLRLIGQKMGLWRHGFALPRSCRQIFSGIDLGDKTVLEIGCGKGILCLWAALHGAREAIGLEPLAEGAYDTNACYRDFRRMADELDLPQARILPYTLQAYQGQERSFDVVLSMASVNHLDEKNCIILRENPEAAQAYVEIFRHLAGMMKPGGRLVITDVARRNLFGDLGVCNPMEPDIEWFKHQQPEFWAELLRKAGFGEPQITWPGGRLLGYLGIARIPRGLAYLFRSIFVLKMTRQA